MESPSHQKRAPASGGRRGERRPPRVLGRQPALPARLRWRQRHPPLEAVDEDSGRVPCAPDQWARIAEASLRSLGRSPTVGTDPSVRTMLDDWTREIEAWSREAGADLSLAEFGIQFEPPAGRPRADGIPLLLHGDLHPGNLLWASQRGWVAIDPQPVVGDAAYEAGAVLRSVMPSAPTASEALRAVRLVGTRWSSKRSAFWLGAYCAT